MSSASSQSDQINDFQDLKSKWSDIEQKLTNLINHKIDGNSISINKLYIEKLTSFIKLMVRLSNNFKSENWNLNEQIDEKFIKKMKDCVIVNSKLLKDTAFFEIKNFVGQNLQAASLVILKFYAFGSLINLILKSECSLKIAKIEEIKSFHIFVLNYLTSLLIAKNFFHLNYFKLIDEKFQISYLSEFNFIKILNKTFKYSLLNSLIYHEQDASLLEFCEIFLFKVLKEKENFQGFSESILGLFEVFFKAMGQNYLQELYILLKKANYPKDLNNNLDKLFFLNCGDEIRKYIFEEIKAKKPEEIFQFFEILKPLFFNDLLHFKPKAYFCFEKITEEDHLSLSNELLENFTNYFESKLLNEFELNVQIISQGNFSNILNFESFEGLIQIITCFMLNEYISKNLDYGLVDFLLNLEKSYRFLIPIGTFHKTVNIIIRNLFEILVVKNNSQDLKFQETFKLFSIVAKDNSFEGMINLSKFLRILSFATVPSNYKNQIDNFFENDLPQIFEKLILNKEPGIKYLGLLAMEIFSTSEKLENINFLFQKDELLSEFTSFLSNEIMKDNGDFKIKIEIVNILNDVFQNKLKTNSNEFDFFSDFVENVENKKKADEIFISLKKLIGTMRPKNVNLMKENLLILFRSNDFKN